MTKMWKVTVENCKTGKIDTRYCIRYTPTEAVHSVFQTVEDNTPIKDLSDEYKITIVRDFDGEQRFNRGATK